jgi:hypothetical protein
VLDDVPYLSSLAFKTEHTTPHKNVGKLNLQMPPDRTTPTIIYHLPFERKLSSAKQMKTQSKTAAMRTPTSNTSSSRARLRWWVPLIYTPQTVCNDRQPKRSPSRSNCFYYHSWACTHKVSRATVGVALRNTSSPCLIVSSCLCFVAQVCRIARPRCRLKNGR